MDRTGLKILLENNKNIQSIISVNTNILLRRFRLKFLRIMCSKYLVLQGTRQLREHLYKSRNTRFEERYTQRTNSSGRFFVNVGMDQCARAGRIVYGRGKTQRQYSNKDP
jgi:uncharacterized protein YbaP (TraB family)